VLNSRDCKQRGVYDNYLNLSHIPFDWYKIDVPDIPDTEYRGKHREEKFMEELKANDIV